MGPTNLKSRRTLAVIALAVVGFLAAVGLRDQFGTGQMSPQMQREVAEAAVYRCGRDVAVRNIDLGHLPTNLVWEAKRSFDGVTTGPKREWWEAGFIRGYRDRMGHLNATSTP